MSTVFAWTVKEPVPLPTPVVLAISSVGTIYAADGFIDESTHIVYAYHPDRTWSVAAGTGVPAFAGDGGPATGASLMHAGDLAIDAAGRLWIADGVSGMGLPPVGRIRLVDNEGVIRTVAGDGYVHTVGDGGSALQAELYLPSAVALDRNGNMYIADTGTERVRRVDPSGRIRTVAGNGYAAHGSDQVAATASSLYAPAGVWVDSAGEVLIADTYNHRLRSIAAGGRIDATIGTGVAGIGSEDMPRESTQLSAPRAACTDRAGTIFVVDSGNHRVLRAAAGALVTTAAGNGSPGFAGDGGLARVSQLSKPRACVLDSAGNLFIADTANNRIRQVTPDLSHHHRGRNG